MKETMAAAINILTSKSSNCFRTNFQKGVPALSKNENHKILEIIAINNTQRKS